MDIRNSLNSPGLSAEQRELLTYLLEEEGIELRQTQAIVSRGNPEELPLSFAQQRLWFLDQLEPGCPVYNIPAAYRLSGPLNVRVLQQSLNEVIRRHEALRTTFTTVDGQPFQVISPAEPFILPVMDLQDLPEAKREDKARRLTAEEARRPFDLARGPLLRATLLRLGSEQHVLFLMMHHIVSDGWSIGVFLQELEALYECFSAGKPSPLSELPIQYADYAAWQRGWLQGEVLAAQLSYWRRQLAGSPPLLQLPTDRLRPSVQTFQGARRSILLPQSLSEGLKALSRQERVTPFMTFLAVFKTLLFHCSGQQDIVVGTPIAGRNRPEIEGLIGCFVNTLVLRTDFSCNPTFREILRRVCEVALGAYSHQDVPFEKLVEELQPKRNLGHYPLFQVWFVFQNGITPTLKLSNLAVSAMKIDTGMAKYDLKLEVTERSDGVRASFVYNKDLFDAATIARMADHFELLLRTVIRDPDTRLNDITEILAEADSQQRIIKGKEFGKVSRQKLKQAKRKAITDSLSKAEDKL